MWRNTGRRKERSSSYKTRFIISQPLFRLQEAAMINLPLTLENVKAARRRFNDSLTSKENIFMAALFSFCDLTTGTIMGRCRKRHSGIYLFIYYTFTFKWSTVKTSRVASKLYSFCDISKNVQKLFPVFGASDKSQQSLFKELYVILHARHHRMWRCSKFFFLLNVIKKSLKVRTLTSPQIHSWFFLFFLFFQWI